MKTYRILAAFLLVLGLVAVESAYGKDKGDSGRLLTGKVLDQSDKPVADAVVYLTNTRTRAIKTYIVGVDGQYHFPALSPNIDYEVYAQREGTKSDTKTVSQFDNRQQVNINLKIDVK